MIDFSIPPELEATRQRVTAFMDQHVYPNESKLVEDEGLPAELESELHTWSPRCWEGGHAPAPLIPGVFYEGK